MAIKRPDIYEHNNPTLAIGDSNFIRGGFRTPVADLTALYALSSKVDQLKEHSSVVYVVAETNYYELIDINNVNNSNGWDLFMGTGSPISGVINGLHVDSGNVMLGGTMTEDSVIELDNNALCFTTDNTNDYGLIDISLNPDYVVSSLIICTSDSGLTGSWWGITGNSTSISLKHYSDSSNGSEFGLNNNCIKATTKISGVNRGISLSSGGVTYDADYSSCYVNRSLVDKEYVDTEIACCSNIVNVNNVGIVYTTLATDDFVGISGSSCVYLYSTPKVGQRVTVADICGGALTNPIKVDGNGKYINDGTISTINTNYGSITYIYNGYCWSATAFVN